MLSAPLNIAVLRALSDRPKALMELRRETGSPSATTIRGRLRTLDETGVVTRNRQDEFPRSLDYEMTPSGHDLVRVAAILDAWLGEAPEGAVPLGSTAAKSAVKALVEGWGTSVVRALAARPLSLTELNGLVPSVSYPSLERRLGAMRLAGLVERAPGSRRGKPYTVTAWLRHGVAPLAAAAAWERRYVPDQTASINRLDIEAAFLLTVPLLEPSTDLSGTCRMAVDAPGRTERRLAGVVVEVGDGAVVSCTSRLEGDVDASVIGSAAAWLAATVEGDIAGLQVAGDCALGRDLVGYLRRGFFALGQRINGARPNLA